jgi:hypothetical protein
VRYVPGLDVWFGFPAASSNGASAQPHGGTDRFARLGWLSIFAVAEGRRVRRP